ncbi:MAG: waaG [Chthonomonadales bacterium]|nr:waaG [Chthonomonadales bacterium]
MEQPTLCMMFESIGSYNAIGKIARNGVLAALDAGWKVTCVADRLDEALQDRVEWLKLYVPPRGFYIKWKTARYFLKQALGSRKFDVVHAHQPQHAAFSDVFQCHFLTRVAYERKCYTGGQGLRKKLGEVQQIGVMTTEDRYYREWNPNTRMLFCSQMIRDEFHRLYGTLPAEYVLNTMAPPVNLPTPEARKKARKDLAGIEDDRPIIGYLGGIDERKGYRQLISGLEGDNDIVLLLAGSNSETFQAPSLAGRYKGLGFVSDVATFFAACDVVAVPSFFDPCPTVIVEAAAHGVPIIATEGVGNLPTAVEYGAGESWDRNTSIVPVVNKILSHRLDYHTSAVKMAEDFSLEKWQRFVLDRYDETLCAKRKQRA